MIRRCVDARREAVVTHEMASPLRVVAGYSKRASVISKFVLAYFTNVKYSELQDRLIPRFSKRAGTNPL
jgi:hypothetical protein